MMNDVVEIEDTSSDNEVEILDAPPPAAPVEIDDDDDVVMVGGESYRSLPHGACADAPCGPTCYCLVCDKAFAGGCTSVERHRHVRSIDLVRIALYPKDEPRAPFAGVVRWKEGGVARSAEVSIPSETSPTWRYGGGGDDEKMVRFYTTRPPLPPFVYKRRRRRCKECSGCLAKDCGECRCCKDMLKFGGEGRLRKACEARKCSSMKL